MQTAIRRTLAATVIALSTTAFVGCNGENPTAATVAPASASFDGGATFGSGNRTADDTTTTTVTNTAEGENTTAADTGSAAKGGATFGSGN